MAASPHQRKPFRRFLYVCKRSKIAPTFNGRPAPLGSPCPVSSCKRRLREVARLTLPHEGRDGMDYVLVGRSDATASLPFDKLQSDFTKALGILHGKQHSGSKK